VAVELHVPGRSVSAFRFERLARPIPALYLGLGVLFLFGLAQSRRSVELGNRLFRGGDTAAAANVYARGLAADPEESEAAFNLGTALLALESPEAEQHLLDGTEAERPEVARRSHYNLGVLLLRQAQPEGDSYAANLLLIEAIRQNRAALLLEPSDSLARWNLAVALRMHHQLAQVVEEAPVEDVEADGNIDEDEDQPPGEAAEGGADGEGQSPPNPDDVGDPEGPRTGAAEALAAGDPGQLSEESVQEMLEAQVDDTEQLIRGLLWSQRPETRPQDPSRAATAGGW
jgi:tetratricopeptide (TPR) repeat protein